MFWRDTRGRFFLASALCGAVLTAGTGAVFVWWKSDHPQRTAEDDIIYDRCLLAQRGNTVACDAMLRVIEHERIAEAAMKQQAAKMLAAGSSKREVVEWARKQGFVSSQLSDAVGISLSDLQSGKY